jgi:hypothetical protein
MYAQKESETVDLLRRFEALGPKGVRSEMERVCEIDDGFTASHLIAAIARISSFSAIERNGHIHVDAARGDWENKISRDTIEKMCSEDMRLPFKAFSIGMHGSMYTVATVKALMTEWNKGFFHELKEDSIVVMYAGDAGKGTWLLTLNRNKMTVKDNIETSNVGEKNKALLYTILSVTLYIAAFKNDRVRVPSKIIKGPAKKKRRIPKHNMRLITLDPNVVLKERPPTLGGSKSDKSWIVRGHWRNQWYSKEGIHQPKWIDPYWKGDGKEQLEKTYRVA